MREVYQLGPVFDSGIFHSDPMDGQGSSLFLYKSGLSILLPLTVPVPHQVWSTEFVIVLVNYHYLVKGPVIRIRTVFVSH